MTRYRPVVFYTLSLFLLAFLLTWPLPLHMGTHAPGDGSDDPAILWNLWWVRFSITELQQHPFHSAWMFWPLGINLVFYTLTTLNALISIPLQISTGLVPSNTFVVYFELAVAACGCWLFLRALLARLGLPLRPSRRQRDALAFLGSLVYAFSASKWLYLSLGQFNIAASHWMPWALLYLLRLRDATTWRRGLREAALCALFLLFEGWTEFTYASFFIQLMLLYWLWYLLVDLGWGERERAFRFTALCGMVAVLFLLGLSPVLWLMAQDLVGSGDFLVEGLGFANVFSNDLLGFLIPGNQHPLFAPLLTGRFNFAYLNFAFIGWATLLLAAACLLRRESRRQGAFWALSALLFALLSLGPTLRINGREFELPLPFDLLLRIPILKANRYPSRYSVMLSLCLAVLVAMGTAALLHRLRARRGAPGRLLLPVLAGLILLEHAGFPLPLSDYRTPEIYHLLADRAGAALLEIPLAWRNGFRVTGTLHPAFMHAQAFQPVHEKRLLSGNTSRNPEFKFQYFTELPVINSLIALESGHQVPEGRVERESEVAAEVLRLLDSPDLIVRRIEQASPPVTTAATLPYLESILDTRAWYDSGEYVGLTVDLPSPPDRYEWDACHPLARYFFAEGWSALPPLDSDCADWTDTAPVALYAGASEAHLLLPSIASSGEWLLRFDTWTPGEGETPVTILAAHPASGGHVTLARLMLHGRQSHEVPVPVDAPRSSLTRIIFRFDALHDATLFLQEWASDRDTMVVEPLPASVGTAPFSLLVESAQEEVGKLSHIYLNGTDVSGVGSGYHVALISPGGALLESRSFNTFLEPGASHAMADFIGQAPADTIIAVAAEDTVSAGQGTGGFPLGDEVFAALSSAGASPESNMQGRFRWSHAFIGVKGAPEGSALEDASAIRPARVALGPPLNSPHVAARFDSFSLVPAP